MNLTRRQLFRKSAYIAGIGISSNILPYSVFAQNLNYGPKEGLARLHWNENYYGPSERAIEAITTSSFKGAYYPDHLVDYLKSMIADHNGLDNTNIAISAGSTQALTILSQVKARQGTILSTGLTYDVHLSLAKNSGARVIRVNDNEDMTIDLQSIESLSRKNVSVVFIVNPNNPSGMIINSELLKQSNDNNNYNPIFDAVLIDLQAFQFFVFFVFFPVFQPKNHTVDISRLAIQPAFEASTSQRMN